MRIDKLPDGTIYRVIAGSFAAWRHDEDRWSIVKGKYPGDVYGAFVKGYRDVSCQTMINFMGGIKQ